MQGFNSDSTRRADSQDAQKPCDLANNESYWRRMYAGMAMQGMMTNSEYMKKICAIFPRWSVQVQTVAEMAVECADALIAELKKKK